MSTELRIRQSSIQFCSASYLGPTSTEASGCAEYFFSKALVLKWSGREFFIWQLEFKQKQAFGDYVCRKANAIKNLVPKQSYYSTFLQAWTDRRRRQVYTGKIVNIFLWKVGCWRCWRRVCIVESLWTLFGRKKGRPSFLKVTFVIFSWCTRLEKLDPGRIRAFEESL